ncbi:MAG: M20/M25/M40 family metallo-hydrolase [Betaproteobacteria bacterium]|nr:M20/M25/M40 family metallo-hydrolase [Betaproteobacteria bacterium]
MSKSARIMLVIVVVFVTVMSFGMTQPYCRPGSAVPIPAADPLRLEAHVRTLSTELHPRSHRHPKMMQLAADYIKESLQETRARVSEQEFEVGGTKFRNIIASFGLEDGKRIIVGAHYDVVEGTPGADDNASGVAGVIELARMLDQYQPTLPFRVDLVAFALEEPPYFRTDQMGSSVYAEQLVKDNVKARAMIALEMIGYFSDQPDSQDFPAAALLRWLYPTQGNFIAVVGSLSDMALVRTIKSSMKGASSLPVYSINAPKSMPGIDFSDHLNFWKHGYPAVMITDTAFYRNKNYHTPDDTAEKLDYQKMAQVVEGVYNALWAVAGD